MGLRKVSGHYKAITWMFPYNLIVVGKDAHVRRNIKSVGWNPIGWPCAISIDSILPFHPFCPWLVCQGETKALPLHRFSLFPRCDGFDNFDTVRPCI
jgi:hypothetical protein